MADFDLSEFISRDTNRKLQRGKNWIKEEFKLKEQFQDSLIKKYGKDTKKIEEDIVKFGKYLDEQREKVSFKEKYNNAIKINKFLAKEDESRLNRFKAGFTAAALQFGEKFAKVAGATFSAISSAAGKNVDNYLNTYQKYVSQISTRLQGSTKSYESAIGTISSAIGSSQYVSQVKVMENLSKLVEAGIVSNVEQRAFLASVSDRIATTFDVFDSNLMRLVRLQQADTTAARLGVESALTSFLNKNFSDTSYLKDVSDSISTILLGVESQLGYKGGTEFEYAVQKWLGSLYSVGVSQNTIQAIAQGLGYLGTGDIESLSGNTALQNLLLLSAQRGGADYAGILSRGYSSTSQIDQIMSGLIGLTSSISSSSPIVKSQYARILGLTVEDITALTNINEKDLQNITNSILDFDSAVQETSIALSTIGERTSISDRISNVIENTFATIGSGIASNPGQLTTWMLTSLLQSSGIADALKFSVLGTSVDPVGILRAGIVGLNAIEKIPTILQTLGSKNLLDLNNFGASTVLSRGGKESTLITTTGVSTGLSLSSYYGTLDEGTLNQEILAKTQEKTETFKGVSPDEDEKRKALLQDKVTSHLEEIYNLLQGWDTYIKQREMY